jgi:uncharacterized coiled-coil protein SlyX
MNDLQTLFQCLAQTFGEETGRAVKAEIQSVINLGQIDVAALNAKITTIQNLLDADPNTPEFDIATNLITQLTSLSGRITALENDTALQSLSSIVNGIDAGLAQLVNQVQDLTAQVTALQNATPTPVDLTEVNAAISGLTTSVSNLQAVDVTQASQITALQSDVVAAAAAAGNALSVANAAAATVAGVSSQISDLQTSQAAQDLAIAAAAGTANAAAASASAANTAVTSLAATVAQGLADAQACCDTTVKKTDVTAIDCAALGLIFRASIAAGIAAPL